MLHQPVVSTRSHLGLSIAVLVATFALVPMEVTTRTVHAAPPADAQERPLAEPADLEPVKAASSFVPGSSAQHTTLPEARFAARTRAGAEAATQDAQASARALEQEAQARAQAEGRAQFEAKLARDAAAKQAEVEQLARRLRELARAQFNALAEQAARDRAQVEASAQLDETRRATSDRLRELAETLKAAQRAGRSGDGDLDRTWRQLQDRRRELATRYTDRHPERIALEQQFRDLEARKTELEAMGAELEARRVALEGLQQRLAEEVERYREAAAAAIEGTVPSPSQK